MRFHSAPVIRLADARPVHLGHAIEADGRWRIFAFAGAGDEGLPGGGIATLCEFLVEDPLSPIRRHTPTDADIDSVLDVRAVFQQGHRDLRLDTMPDLLLPAKFVGSDRGGFDNGDGTVYLVGRYPVGFR